MIKILNSEIIQEGRKIKITIEREGRNVFVYPIDKFADKAELIAEIEASITNEENKKIIKDTKINKLKEELKIS